MDPRDFLKQFDKDFQIDSIPESSQASPYQKSPKRSQAEEKKQLENNDLDMNFSFSGLNDSSHFDLPKMAQEKHEDGEPMYSAPRTKPTLDDIPNFDHYLSPRSPLEVPNPEDDDIYLSKSPEYNQSPGFRQNYKQVPNPSPEYDIHANFEPNVDEEQFDNNGQYQNQDIHEYLKQNQVPNPVVTEQQRPEPKQFSVPSFSFTSTVPSTPTSNVSHSRSNISPSPIQPSNARSFNHNVSSSIQSTVSSETQNVLNTIQDLKRERAKDAEKLKVLMTENARLQAKLTMLEHTDIKVAELGSKVEQLLQDYLENEQVRSQQAAIITQLRQEVIVLKSRMQSSMPSSGQNVPKPRVRFD